MSIKRIEKVKNGDEYVDYVIYKCDITGEEIPEEFGWCGDDNLPNKIHISDNGMDLLIEQWIHKNSIYCGYPIILHYLIDRFCKRKKPNRYISQKLKKKVLKKYKHECVICKSTEKLEFDHIKPISRGGLSIFSNLQILCKKCNSRKGNK